MIGNLNSVDSVAYNPNSKSTSNQTVSSSAQQSKIIDQISIYCKINRLENISEEDLNNNYYYLESELRSTVLQLALLDVHMCKLPEGVCEILLLYTLSLLLSLCSLSLSDFSLSLSQLFLCLHLSIFHSTNASHTCFCCPPSLLILSPTRRHLDSHDLYWWTQRSDSNRWVCLTVCLYVYMHISIYMYVCMYVFMYVCMFFLDIYVTL